MVIKQHTELVLATFVFETDRPHHQDRSCPPLPSTAPRHFLLQRWRDWGGRGKVVVAKTGHLQDS